MSDVRTVENAERVLLAVFKYREACDAVQPAWIAMFQTRTSSPERTAAQALLKEAMQKVRDCRAELILLALDGRSEVPR